MTTRLKPQPKRKPAVKEIRPAMLFYGRDFYADENVMVMTLAQEAAYMRAIWCCWQEGSLPGDMKKLAAICGKNMAVGTFERQIWPALQPCFTLTPKPNTLLDPKSEGEMRPRWVHKRVESIREETERRASKFRESGKLGAEGRWKKNLCQDGVAIDTPMANTCLSSSSSSSSSFAKENTKNICASDTDARVSDPPASSLFPGSETTDPKKERQRRLEAQQTAWFEEWWAAYWLKKSRKRARESFGRQVLTEERFHQVMEATRAQSPEMLSREPRHRPMGASWLNAERWNDGPDPAQTEKADADRDQLRRLLTQQ
jgi:hypothetical protein